MRRLQEFEPLPIGRPVPGIAGFKLYGEGGPSARREAQDRERAREIDRLLASTLGERWEFYRLHGVFPRR